MSEDSSGLLTIQEKREGEHQREKVTMEQRSEKSLSDKESKRRERECTQKR